MQSPQSPPSARDFSPSSVNDISAVSDISAANNDTSSSPPPLTSMYSTQTTADCTSSLNRPTYAMTAYQYSPTLGFYPNVSSLSLTSSGSSSSSSDLSSSPTPPYTSDLNSSGGYAANNIAPSATATYVPSTTSIYPVAPDYSSQYPSSVSVGYPSSSGFPLLRSLDFTQIKMNKI